jgi:hypothetical protein
MHQTQAAYKLLRPWTHRPPRGRWAAAASAGPGAVGKAAKSCHRKWRRYLRKITRRVRALHEQAAAWLLDNYKEVLLVSNMNTRQMVVSQVQLSPSHSATRDAAAGTLPLSPGPSQHGTPDAALQGD